ncbi:MAG: 3-oxoacyl-ACP synthase, partial [Polyangiaceae bacterium]|nr:3-oxoacyl-ACP synthase [Polyangiaceae bacterium]
MAGITIIGTGSYAPGEPVPNAALSRVMDTTDEWIRQRTGIHQRHYVEDGVGVSDLGKEAAERAIAAAGIDRGEIDYIIFATMTPEHLFPGSGGILGAKLGIERVPALDIRQQCAAMPYSLQLANGLVASKAARTVLIVGADAHAGFMPWKAWDVVRGRSDRAVPPEEFAFASEHRGMAVLFGDGAGAMIVREASEGRGYLGSKLHTDGRIFQSIYIPLGFTSLPYVSQRTVDEAAHIPRMKGQDLFKTAVKELSSAVRALCSQAGVEVDDVDWFVAHQANDRINDAVRQALKLPPEKVPSNIAR